MLGRQEPRASRGADKPSRESPPQENRHFAKQPLEGRDTSPDWGKRMTDTQRRQRGAKRLAASASFCRTLKMSHDRSWHPRRLRRRSASCGRWLWRLVRRNARLKPRRRIKALAGGWKSKRSFFAHAEARLNYDDRAHAMLHSNVSPPSDSNFRAPVFGKRDALPDRITLGLRIPASPFHYDLHII